MVAFLENSGYVKPWHWQKIFDVFRWSQEIISSPASYVRYRSPGMPASAHWVPECSPPSLGRPRTFPAPARVGSAPPHTHRITGPNLQLTASLWAEGHSVICWSFYPQPNGLFTLYLHYQGPCTLRAACVFFAVCAHPQQLASEIKKGTPAQIPSWPVWMSLATHSC